MAGRDRLGQLFPGPQRTGGRRHHPGRRDGRRRSHAPHHQTNRQRRTWRTGARPARPAFFRAQTAALLFDAIFGGCAALGARPERKADKVTPLPEPECWLERHRGVDAADPPDFEGYRLLREYFMMPERFHYGASAGCNLSCAAARAGIEIVFLLRRPAPELADLTPADFELFATPDHQSLRARMQRHRARPAQDAAGAARRPHPAERLRDLPRPPRGGRRHRRTDADIPALFGLGQNRGNGWVYSTERRPRRATEDERREGLTRTSYTGDDVFLAVSRPAGPSGPAAQTHRRDGALHQPRPADPRRQPDLDAGERRPGAGRQAAWRAAPAAARHSGALPAGADDESRADELAWRLVAQLALNFLSLAKEGRGVDPLHALLDLYADRGDPGLARHVRSIVRIDSRPVIERLAIDGPLCFGRGTEVTLHVDQSVLAGQSTLLLSALLCAAVRPPRRNKRLRADPHAAAAEAGGCAMADDARQSLPDLDKRRTAGCPRRSTSSSCCASSNSEAGLFGHSGRPDREPARLGQHVRLGFSRAGRGRIPRSRRTRRPARVTVANLGLLGPEGPHAAASDALGARSPVAALVRRRRRAADQRHDLRRLRQHSAAPHDRPVLSGVGGCASGRAGRTRGRRPRSRHAGSDGGDRTSRHAESRNPISIQSSFARRHRSPARSTARSG